MQISSNNTTKPCIEYICGHLPTALQVILLIAETQLFKESTLQRYYNLESSVQSFKGKNLQKEERVERECFIFLLTQLVDAYNKTNNL